MWLKCQMPDGLKKKRFIKKYCQVKDVFHTATTTCMYLSIIFIRKVSRQLIITLLPYTPK